MLSILKINSKEDYQKYFLLAISLAYRQSLQRMLLWPLTHLDKYFLVNLGDSHCLYFPLKGTWKKVRRKSLWSDFISCSLRASWACLPGGSGSKESACNTGDLGSIPRLGRSPGEGNGNLLQYSCLDNSIDRGAGGGYSPWGLKESDMTEWLTHLQELLNLSASLWLPWMSCIYPSLPLAYYPSIYHLCFCPIYTYLTI